MRKIKIIFFDIDGTLLRLQAKKLSEKTVEALNRLKANGIKLCIATGRTPVSLPHFGGIEFDTFLTFNGSLCYNDTETIFSNPISPDNVQKLIRNADSLGRPVAVATKNRLAANGLDIDLSDYYSIAHLQLTVAEDFEQVSNEEVYQLLLGCRKTDYSAILKDVDGAKIAAWWDRAVDIIPANGGKGIGIQKVLEYYHLDKSEALAFGDGNNDIEMLLSVGTGVAMGNASPQLKEIANEICKDVAEDGIYDYCLTHGLI